MHELNHRAADQWRLGRLELRRLVGLLGELRWWEPVPELSAELQQSSAQLRRRRVLRELLQVQLTGL